MGNGNSERQANVEKKSEAVAMIYEPVTHTCRSGDAGNGEVTVARESRVRSAMIVATHQIRRQKRQGNSTEGTQNNNKKNWPQRGADAFHDYDGLPQRTNVISHWPLSTDCESSHL